MRSTEYSSGLSRMLNIRSWTKIKLETEAKDNGVSEGHKAWSTTVLSPWSANPTSFQFDSSFFVIQKLRLCRNTGPKSETDFLAFSKCPREQQNESKQLAQCWKLSRTSLSQMSARFYSQTRRQICEFCRLSILAQDVFLRFFNIRSLCCFPKVLQRKIFNLL